MEERDNLHLRYWYEVTVNQIMTTTGICVAMTSSKEQRSLVWTDLRQHLDEVCLITV